ncbi:nitrile hydratase accessory protein [Parageobacillus toebii]|uniref:nitrile hydratase accessory protein n=1 Tax=Parageobacillus toebii TaxID=153151 RepID=UPI002E1C005B|nr:nitrile hydratase accessory protein [Parageobacillus toebii]
MAQQNSKITPDEILPNPKRKEEEPLFNALWEARVFAMAVHLYEKGVYHDWEVFRDRFISEIAVAERLPEEERPTYYENWLSAFEKMLIGEGILTEEQINQRIKELETGKIKIC